MSEDSIECEIEDLLNNLKNDGAFDCEHSRDSVKDYFKGQCDAIESITKQVHKLLECINLAKNEFIEILKHVESFENTDCEHNTEH